MVIESVLSIQDLDHETFAHVDTENRRQTLEEQTEFLKSVHDEVQRHTRVEIHEISFIIDMCIVHICAHVLRLTRVISISSYSLKV